MYTKRNPAKDVEIGGGNKYYSCVKELKIFAETYVHTDWDDYFDIFNGNQTKPTYNHTHYQLRYILKPAKYNQYNGSTVKTGT